MGIFTSFADTVSAPFAHEAEKKERKKADKLADEVIELYDHMSPAAVEEAVAQELGPSALAQLQTDPKFREAQYRALAQFDLMRESGGMTLADEAAQNKALNQVARKEAAGRGAITNDMAARGTLGSGAELAMKLQNQQGAAMAANDVGQNTLANAQRRYLESVMGQGQMAGQMRGQDYGEKSNAARAQDAINAYNAQARERALNQRNANRNTTFNQQIGINEHLGDAKLGRAGRYDTQGAKNSAFTKGMAHSAGEATDQFGEMAAGGGMGGGGMGGMMGGGGGGMGGLSSMGQGLSAGQSAPPQEGDQNFNGPLYDPYGYYDPRRGGY